jgi:hypothetical protein
MILFRVQFPEIANPSAIYGSNFLEYLPFSCHPFNNFSVCPGSNPGENKIEVYCYI